jgi:sigma-B regulation protein RsbU (phosphoserine phosphatase)
MYLAGVEILLYLLQQLFRFVSWTHAADMLSGWIASIGFVFLVLLAILLLKWVRRRVMWSLRNRLIVTYVFIGVIPVILLLAMAIVAGFLFTGQFATFLATSDIQNSIANLDTANTALAHALAPRIARGETLSIPPNPSFPGRYLTVWHKGRPLVLVAPGISRETLEPISPPPGKGDIKSLVKDGSAFFLRASTRVPIGNDNATVISSVPLNREMLESMTGDLGEVTISEGVDIEVSRQEDGATIRARQGSTAPTFPASGHAAASKQNLPSDSNDGAKPTVTVRSGKVPAPSGRFDQAVDFIAPISLLNWHTGETQRAAVLVSTRKSLLFDRLFANLGSNANAILVVLAAIGVALGILELFALLIGVRLTRTMTGSVHHLYTATQHINRGDLSYRILVKSHDQMAELETSFNSMSQSLERLIEEQKEKQRIESELAIAQEVQAQLFPRQVSGTATLDIRGICRPARTVSGDYYDFLPMGEEKLGIAVGDISGKGISAALLMATIHSAVRVYEMGRLPVREQLVAAGAAAVSAAAGSTSLMPASVLQSPASVLCLLNRHLYHSTPPEKYATMFFGLWNGNTHELTYSNGGHLPPLVVRQNGIVERLEAGGTVVGLFDQMVYEERTIELYPGDLFVAYSDGLTEPENEFGEFGEERLVELVREARNMELPRVSEMVTAAVLDWIGAAEQPDDITLVLARAK